MASQFKGVVKVTALQLKELIANGFITVDDVVHIYQPNNFLYITDESGVDEQLSSTSTNPVENRVITLALDSKADKTNVYTKSETDDTFLNIKPDKTNELINNNDKINLKYIPDVILGQLKFGGLARPIYAAGVEDEYINFRFSNDAKIQLGLDVSEQTLRLQDIDVNKWEGLYFIVARYDNHDATSNWDVKTGESTIINLTIGDWLLSTGAVNEGGVNWQKVDNTDAVQSVAGKTGAIELNIDDISGLTEALNKKVNLNKTEGSLADISAYADGSNDSGLVFNSSSNNNKYLINRNYSKNSLEIKHTVDSFINLPILL